MADGVIPERRPHRSKFLLAYFVLAAIVGIGVAAFLVLMETDTGKSSASSAQNGPPAAWNGFRPRGFEADQVHQIATYISSTYHLPNGRELVAVKASIPPSLARELPPRHQELIGHHLYPEFLGFVDGRHPRKVHDRPV